MKLTFVFSVLGCLSSAAWAVEPPPPTCTGSPAYKFAVQVSLNGGSTWINNSATLWIKPNRQVSIMARTLLTVTTGQTQGWSFGLEYDNASQTQYGGNMSATAVTTSGTQTMTVQNGGPPDMNATAIRSGYKGYTQGIVVDTDQVYTLAPTSNFVTSKACFSITSGGTYSSYPIYLKFTHAIGNPNIYTVVTQNGLSTVPCAQNFTLTVTVNPSVTIPGGCSISGGGPMGPGMDGGAEGGGVQAGVMGPTCPKFKRGDSNGVGGINLTDAIFTFNFLFLGGPTPGCSDAMDCNDDGRRDLSDGIYTLNFLFIGGLPPPAPGPSTCGEDPTADALDCQTYEPCQNCGCALAPFVELTSTSTPSFATELMATKDVQLGDFDKDGDLDCFIPQSRGGPCQPDHVYVNRINESPSRIEVRGDLTNLAGSDHDGMGNWNLVLAGNTNCPFPNPCEIPPGNQCAVYETTYASAVADIGGPGGAGPDTWPDIITVNGADYMRVLINQRTIPPSFVDEGGKVVLNAQGTGYVPDSMDTTKRIYNCQASGTDCTQILDRLGPLPSMKSMFQNLMWFQPDLDKRASLDDIDVGDIDLDGDLDMVIANRDSSTIYSNLADSNFILRNRGRPAEGGGTGIFDLFGFTAMQESNMISTHDTALGDYDHDGDLDLVTASDNDQNKLWRNTAAQTPNAWNVANPATLFEEVTTGGIGETERSSHAAFVDLNGDGWLDIHLGGETEFWSAIFWNNANPPNNTFTQASGPWPMYSAAYGDLNGDGRIDMVTVYSIGAEPVKVYFNCRQNGTNVFVEAPGVLPSTGWAASLGVAVADLDGAGDLDIVITQGDGGNPIPNRIFLNVLIP